ncbi:2163_t:CDS:2, partial [Racocetra fulgida]
PDVVSAINSITADNIFDYYQQEMPNNQLSQVYQVIIQDLEEVLESNFFKEDTTRVLKDIRDTWVDCGRSYDPDRWQTWGLRSLKFGITNAEVDKWAEESVNVGKEKIEPSVRRSPRPMKRVNYAEDNSDEERKMRRVNSTAHSQSTESPQPRTPPQAPRVLTPLKTTPNKRPRNKEEIQRYSEDISVICAFDKSVSELTLEIGEELAIELSSIRDINPAVWSDALEKYVDTSLKETGKKFKTAIQATRYSDGQEVWHMEVAGGPCKTTDLHTLGDTKKTMRMDVLNLIGILRNHFDCDIKLATKIKDEITKQEELMGEIERSVLRSKGTTVRHVLKIPDELFK